MVGADAEALDKNSVLPWWSWTAGPTHSSVAQRICLACWNFCVLLRPFHKPSLKLFIRHCCCFPGVARLQFRMLPSLETRRHTLAAAPDLDLSP